MLNQVRSKSRTRTEVTEAELRRAILVGDFLPGSQLPSEAELINMLNVSRTTIREALRSLEDDGLVIRRQGVGTFVLERPILNNFGINYGVTEMIRISKMTPGVSEFKVTEQPSKENVASQLSIEPGSMVTVIERVRTANKKPVVYSLDYLSSTLVSAKDIKIKSKQNFSLYDFLQKEIKINIGYGVARITPIKASKKVAKKLAQEEDAVLLFISQTDYLTEDKPVLHTHEYNLPDAFDYGFLRRRPSNI